MKYLSTFSGIGGFELGIQLAYDNLLYKGRGEQSRQKREYAKGNDIHTESIGEPICIGYSEINKYASQIYQSHFSYERCQLATIKRGKERGGQTNTQGNEDEGLLTAPGKSIGIEAGQPSEHNRDIAHQRQLNCQCKHKPYGDITSIVAEDLPDFDLLVGGFPCQSFSIAGKRGGFNDTRGTMFFELARILRAKQPRLFVFENVKGLLSHDGGRTFATIIQTLEELGYDLQWQVLNSKNHGVPQNRERVFIIGHLRGTCRPKVFPFTGATKSTTGKIKVIGNLDSPTWLKRNESIRRVHDITGISPTIPTGMGGGGMNKVLVPEATKKGYAVAHEGDSINLSVPNSKTRRGRVGHGVAQTLDTGMQQHTLQNSQIRRLTPTECERLQGFPDDYTKYGGYKKAADIISKNPEHGAAFDYISDTQRYKTLGNAVTVNVIRDIMIRLLKT